MIIRIENHIEQALDRLIEQYREKPNIRDLLASLIHEIQNLENATFDLKDRLDVFAVNGRILDLFGTIVVQARLGLPDDIYRLLLLAKVGINVSNGEPERIASTFKILTQADFVHYMNHSKGEFSIATDGEIPPDFLNFIFAQMERTAAAGVRISEFVFHDKDEPFMFDGPNGAAPGGGFGTLADPAIGGLFAWLERFDPSFAMDGDDTSSRGFGSLEDPLAGGAFTTV